MGAPRLKKKIELNYRRGGTSRYCSICNHFISLVSSPPRCKIIGLEGGRLFNINPQNICDQYDPGKYLKRLKGDP